ncbi:hypothetical protein LIER_05966 [Lithospermum erythrorhizon]|uniref:Uncharacterized protein n=1 Tax=Lithospermum erythrorhizon TaxID=34254 RepID=A0AAV3P4A2_LITER
MTCPTCKRDLEYLEGSKPTQPGYSSPSSGGATPIISMEGSQSKYGSHCDSSYSYMPITMTGTTTIEEQIPSLTRMVEDMAKHMQRQEASLSHMVEKILDDEHRTQAAEANLKSLPP